MNKKTLWIIAVISTLISLVILKMITGDWCVALVLVSIVLVHELGHLVVAIHSKFTIILFIVTPFGGALSANIYEANPSRKIRYHLAGPLIGLFVTTICVLLAVVYSHLLIGRQAAIIGICNALLNIPNMIPLYPLDGGRFMTDWLGRWKWTFIVSSLVMYIYVLISWTNKPLAFPFIKSSLQNFSISKLEILPLILITIVCGVAEFLLEQKTVVKKEKEKFPIGMIAIYVFMFIAYLAMTDILLRIVGLI